MRHVSGYGWWVLCSVGFALLPGVAVAAQKWPLIRPMERRIPMDWTGDMFDVRLPIRSREGRVLYEFRCIGGSSQQLDDAGERDGENYVAPLICTLSDQSGGPYGGLLGEDSSAIWYSRGQYHGTDLVGACGRYPEFGRVRHFRLRGMKLTLAAERVVVQQGKLRTMTLHVTAVPDADAHTAIAERPGYLDPKGNCRNVRRGKEPLMCRNEGTLSWQVCSPAQRREMGYPARGK